MKFQPIHSLQKVHLITQKIRLILKSKTELSATAEQIKNQIRAYSSPEFQVPKFMVTLLTLPK